MATKEEAREKIKELIVKNYRFIFFIEKHDTYFVRAFIKKTRKAPRREIEAAEKIHKMIIKKWKKIQKT